MTAFSAIIGRGLPALTGLCFAWVVESVDTRDLKSLGRKAIRVRVSSQALTLYGVLALYRIEYFLPYIYPGGNSTPLSSPGSVAVSRGLFFGHSPLPRPLFFVRIHQSLRVAPAMEAGVTDYLWTIEDIAKLAD